MNIYERSATNLETIVKVPDTFSLSINMSKNDDFVTTFEQAFSKIINMRFNATSIWTEKVRDQTEINLGIRTQKAKDLRYR